MVSRDSGQLAVVAMVTGQILQLAVGPATWISQICIGQPFVSGQSAVAMVTGQILRQATVRPLVHLIESPKFVLVS